MKQRLCATLLATFLASWPRAAAAQPELGDAQIAHILITANQVDVDAGKLARTKSLGTGTRAFAEQMINDHNAVNAEVRGLVKRLRLKPEDNAVSRSLHREGRDNLASLRGLTKGPSFDRAYLAHEIAYHEAVVGALDTSLVPGATNAELKALLAKVRPAFAAHLEHARQLQSTLPR